MPRPPLVFVNMKLAQENELRDLRKDPYTPRETLKRIDILLFSITGQGPASIAELVGSHLDTVYKSIHDFNAVGVNSVFGKERPVRKPTFTLEIEDFVTQLVSSKTDGWNARTITEKINEKFSDQLPAPLKVPTVYANLRRMGLTWQRSRFIPAVYKQDPVVYQKIKAGR
jgi:transposase